jgi:hypothetical protein
VGYGIVDGQSVTVYSPPFPGSAIPPKPPGTNPDSAPSWGEYEGYWASFNPVSGGGLQYLGNASPDWSGGYPTSGGNSTPRSGIFPDSGGGYTLLISDSRGLVFTKEYDSPIDHKVVCDCEEDCLPVYSDQQSSDFLCVCSGNANDDLEAMKEKIKQELKAELPPIIKAQLKAELIPELGPLLDAKIEQKFQEKTPDLKIALAIEIGTLLATDSNFMTAFADILASNDLFLRKLKDQVNGITYEDLTVIDQVLQVKKIENMPVAVIVAGNTVSVTDLQIQQALQTRFGRLFTLGSFQLQPDKITIPLS